MKACEIASTQQAMEFGTIASTKPVLVKTLVVLQKFYTDAARQIQDDLDEKMFYASKAQFMTEALQMT